MCLRVVCYMSVCDRRGGLHVTMTNDGGPATSRCVGVSVVTAPTVARDHQFSLYPSCAAVTTASIDVNLRGYFPIILNNLLLMCTTYAL